MSPASVLAHGGSDSDAFCDDKGYWIDSDWYGARLAREEYVHVCHGCVVVLKEWYGYCLCMYTGNRVGN